MLEWIASLPWLWIMIGFWVVWGVAMACVFAMDDGFDCEICEDCDDVSVAVLAAVVATSCGG